MPKPKSQDQTVLDVHLPSTKPNKYYEIARTIKGRILSGEIAYRLPTIAEMAKEFKVTLVTMQKSMDLLKEDGCVTASPGRGSFATRLKRPRSHVLGALLSGRGPLALKAAAGMQHQAQLLHEGVVISHYDVESEDPTELLKQFIAKQRVDGLILLPHLGATGQRLAAMLDFLKSESLPYVLIPLYKLQHSPAHSTIFNKDEVGALEVMEHLHSIGCREIAFVYNKEDAMRGGSHGAVRYQEYARFMKEMGLGIREAFRIQPSMVEEPESIRAAGDKLRELDAVICDTDAVAMQILQICLSERISVPYDLAVTGIDNLPASEQIGLTSVDQHFEKIGAKAVEVLLDEIEGRRREPVHVEINSELILRRSTSRH